MQIIEWQQFLENGLSVDKNSSMTIGIFDGVHRGHRALLERVVSQKFLVPVVVTFKKAVSNYLLGMRKGDIYSFQQRLELFEKLGIEITIVIDLTDEFKKTTGLEFLKMLQKQGRPGYLAVGSGFRCGYQMDTDAAAIQRFFAPVPVDIVPPVLEGSEPVSSSRIRQALADGDIPLAKAMLGGAMVPKYHG